MSRILIDGQFNGQTLPVVIGWDRPLQHCFLQFDLSDEQADEPAFEPVLEVSAETLFAPLSVEDVRSSLTRAGVAVPDGAFAELQQHMAANAGNAVVKFTAQGERTVLA